MYKTLFLLLAGLVIFFSSSPAKAEDGKNSDPTAEANAEKQEGAKPAPWLIDFYRKHISAVDGDRCPSLPSCSAYSAQAIRKHGIVIGWIMTVDRLIHEGREETRVSPMVFSHGRWKIYDPVENNDFWWYRPHKRKGHE